MADVFLSHARKDLAIARLIAEHVEKQGRTVFWDASLRAGQDFSEVLLEELDSAKCAVVLWSSAACASGWVRDEAARAKERGILVPILIEDAVIPLGFGHLHTESLVGWTGSASDERLQRILDAVAAIAPKARPSRKNSATSASGDAGRITPGAAASRPRTAVVTASSRAGVASPKAAHLEQILRLHASSPKARGRAVDEYCAQRGDPRFRPDGWFLPADPMLGFIEIPAGPFTMGSDKRRDKKALDDELRAHPVTLPAFFIARFPVTVAQFRAYVEDAGVTPGDADCLRGVANYPVANVSWHEALAYCDWLARKLGEWAWTPDALARVLRPTRKGAKPWRVTLASEAEWEKAARGTDGRIYPWEGPADPNKANYYDTGIGGTSAVGCFPSGASPYGVEELSGNVWEWTRSLWRAYPYEPGQDRENVKAGENKSRVVRGGSFYDFVRLVRAADRPSHRPDLRLTYLGFRVVVSPFFSDL